MRIHSSRRYFERYPGGGYLIRDDLLYQEDVRRFIVEMEFIRTDRFSSVETTNLRHRMHAVRLSDALPVLIQKAAWINPAYPVLRRINLRLTWMFKNYSLLAYEAALRLREAGIPAVEVVATWTHRPRRGPRENYLLYERVAAVGTLKQELLRLTGPAHARRRRALLEDTARLARRIHNAGFRHGDLSICNVLVCQPGADEPLRVLDAGRLRHARIQWRPWKTLFDLREFRRLRLAGVDEYRLFLRAYFGGGECRGWFRIMRFWQWRGSQPLRAVRHVLVNAR